tara:strand:+ start:1709 stop:1969 length:261 start_codon:yes stop_codon:yes gene_type:complete
MNNFKDQLTTELINIDNTECTVSAAFNIGNDRFEEIMNTLKSKSGPNINKECASEYMSRVLYSCNPKSILEVFVIGQAIGAALNMD